MELCSRKENVMEKKSWWQSKTVWTGISGVIAAVGGVVTGTLLLSQGIQLAVTALIGIFLRSAVNK